MNKTRLMLYAVFFILLIPIFSSCKEDEPEIAPDPESLILIYAVAANNLEYNLTLDMREILTVAPQLGLERNKVLVYSVVKSGECKLQELQKNADGSYSFITILTYPELPLSTSGERISEVLDYVAYNFNYPTKGLVLWSHATGWIPTWGESTPSDDKRRTFGSDKYEGIDYQTNINELADAIPAGVFKFIWFDCCYMGNIETIYQLKDKTESIVGYVTEIMSNGMPYDLTMPYLLKREPNLETAAELLFNYYNSYNAPVTVSIVETDKLSLLAAASAKVFESGTPPDAITLTSVQNYSRLSGHKFYDMGQLLESYGNLSEDIVEDLKNAFSQAVIYKAISERDFNNPSRPMNVQKYSGLSMHNFTFNGSEDNAFYSKLDWYKATRIKENADVTN